MLLVCLNLLAKIRKVEHKTKEFILFFCRDGVPSPFFNGKGTNKRGKDKINPNLFFLSSENQTTYNPF